MREKNKSVCKRWLSKQVLRSQGLFFKAANDRQNCGAWWIRCAVKVLRIRGVGKKNDRQTSANLWQLWACWQWCKWLLTGHRLLASTLLLGPTRTHQLAVYPWFFIRRMMTIDILWYLARLPGPATRMRPSHWIRRTLNAKGLADDGAVSLLYLSSLPLSPPNDRVNCALV